MRVCASVHEFACVCVLYVHVSVCARARVCVYKRIFYTTSSDQSEWVGEGRCW